jgi:hypothetical protein
MSWFQSKEARANKPTRPEASETRPSVRSAKRNKTFYGGITNEKNEFKSVTKNVYRQK